MNADPLFFDATRHCEALALLASRRLNDGDFVSAFRYADRRCRLLKPGVHDLLLRSEASRRAGYAQFAAQDLDRALDVDPTDPMAKRLALLWGTDEQQRQAARGIVADGDSDRDALRRAVALLFADGAKILRRLTRADRGVTGWVAWPRGALALRVEAAATQTFDVPPDRAHGLTGGQWSIADIAALDPRGDIRRLVFLLDGVEVDCFAPPHVMGPAREPAARPAPFAARGATAERVTVIVPVYEDYEATRACLEALFAEGGKIERRVIVIDDASPNVRLRGWLDHQATLRKFHLIRNERNLGFAVSVNKALALCARGDVLLLNADVLPPPSCLDRLAEVARSRPGVGTVTPLSNNGEFTSFPAPNKVNPLGAPDEVARLDALARQANGAAAVELPNGIGFCLYITRACLNAVGPLPEIYARGYYEDVEFCLRAHEKGFSNLCAVGVYVGHHGSLSFGAEKRRLVMRNLRTLERRFPSHALECAAFLGADPLRPWRAAIEALAPPRGPVTLMVCGEGAAEILARDESKRRTALAGEPATLLCVYARPGDRVSLRGVGRAGPHSLCFALRDARESAALIAYLRQVELARVEIFDPLSLPTLLLKLATRLRKPIDLVGADFEWVFPARAPIGAPCQDPAGEAACGACAVAYAPGEAESSRARRMKRRRILLAEAQKIRPLDRMSEVFARQIFGEDFVLRAPAVVSAAPRAKKAEGALAIVAPEPSALADRMIVGLGRALSRRGAATSVVVLGGCVDDLATMAPGNVFVAGPVETDEYERLFRQYEICALMSPYRTRFFGRLDYLSQLSGLPKAYFDWTFGKMPRTAGDLALDPRLCDAKAAANVAAWLHGEGRETIAP